ncbi:MAG TPA: hypothetical protein VFJ84_00325 [Candidatus Saccharimonadales bacterium]|nr:hypothetical protein [Candidatus Saccharimonadales bacterium]
MFMLTETKTPQKRTSLIPAPGQSLEAARDNYFGGTVPAEASAQADVSTTRTERGGRLNKALSYGAALVAAAGIGAATTEIAQWMGNTEHPAYLNNSPAHVKSSHE